MEVPNKHRRYQQLHYMCTIFLHGSGFNHREERKNEEEKKEKHTQRKRNEIKYGKKKGNKKYREGFGGGGGGGGCTFATNARLLLLTLPNITPYLATVKPKRKRKNNRGKRKETKKKRHKKRIPVTVMSRRPDKTGRHAGGVKRLKTLWR